jgi:uncharacterized protein (UPF0261 family)
MACDKERCGLIYINRFPENEVFHRSGMGGCNPEALAVEEEVSNQVDTVACEQTDLNIWRVVIFSFTELI